jgi:hypothetical protein
MTYDLGEGVIQLVSLVNARLRTIAAEAEREVAGIDGGDILSRLVLREDGEAEGGRVDCRCRVDDRVIEARVVDGEVVDRAGAEGANVVIRELVVGMTVDLREPGNGSTGEGGRRSSGGLLIEPNEVHLILGVRREADVGDVLIDLGGGDVVEDVAVGSLVGSGHILRCERGSNGVKAGGGEDAAVVGCALRPGSDVRCAIRDVGQRAGDDGVGEGIAESAAIGIKVVREVTGQLGGGEDGSRGAAIAIRHALMGSLVGEHEEQLVLDDGTTHIATEDVLVVGSNVLMLRRGGSCGNVIEEVTGIEERVAIELEGVAVEPVCAGL